MSMPQAMTQAQKQTQTQTQTIRRGLPRRPAGEPWPPTATAIEAAPSTPAAGPAPAEDRASASAPATRVRQGLPRTRPTGTADGAPGRTGADVPVSRTRGPEVSTAGTDAGNGTRTPLRRGLPRSSDGDPWPPAGFAPSAPAPVPVEAPAPPSGEPAPSRESAPSSAAPRPAERRAAPVPPDTSTLPRVIAGVFAIAALLILAATIVAFTRWIVSLSGMQEFLTRFPGEYPLPEGADRGFPAWARWQHFFNVFLIVLIIRSGLHVRHQRKPAAFWSPRRDPARKISISLWLHQSLDLLWVVNGVVFVVLLFATGHWMRIVPTSWEVFPNALSAAIQYVSLDWPTENGWANYNSLQQLAYFATVFIAAPLAVATGVRMSGLWPKKAGALDRVYPVEVARAIHYPVMLYFVTFIVAHVALVFATGALRNLNHMYAGQDVVNWAGFWIFVASLVVIGAAWVAARPLVLAPIARLFGTVSAR